MNFKNENLRKLRNKINYSQEFMADKLGMDHSSYNRLENGKQKLKMEDIPKIATAFNKSKEEILTELTGWTLNNSNHDNSQNNQNLIINLEDKELLIQLLKDKDKLISLLEEKITFLENKI
ncbi:MAG: helix-turn-helix transcriptional regulator [Cytophagaceae bacterium]|nr:helix-turn-helix transcriptional regulator [Cytophagaceae bacterium]